MKRFVVAVLFVLNLAHAQVPSDPAARQAYFDAQYARILDFQKRHTVTVRGAENPAAIKRGAALNMFFQTLPGGPTTNAATFSQFAAARFGASLADAAVLRNAGKPQPPPIADVCALVLDGSLADGMAIAKRITDTNDAINRAAEVHYQAVINKLTPTTRTKVSQAVKEQAANMDSVNMDYLAMAAEDPELFKTMITASCRGKQSALAMRPPTAPDVVNENGVLSRTQR